MGKAFRRPEVRTVWLALKDKYGLSWQIVPTAMNELMKDKDEKKLARVTEAFLKMKKFDIAKLKEAYERPSESAA